MKDIRLSVIVPCYNEEKRFRDGILHYLSFLRRENYLWELILVNDGSSDQTEKLMHKIEKQNKNVVVISYPKNRGKGFAIAEGARQAKGKYILFSDLDHSVSVETIKKFYKYFEKGYLVVIGSRRVSGAKFIKRQKPFREFLGRGFTLLVRLFIDWQVKDATCGFKAFENNSAKQIFNKITVYDWAFDAEILFLCKKYNIKYAQVPVTWGDRQGSKVSLLRDVARSLFGVLKIRLNDLQGKY